MAMNLTLLRLRICTGPINRSILMIRKGRQILRDFVDAQEVQPSQRASQNSNAVMDLRPRKRQSRRHSRSRHEIAIPDASAEELMHHLAEQKKETNTLRRALRLAVERVEAEAQRVAELERDTHKTIEHYTTLNESRMAEQQEALKANSELRLYQFQLERAQKEVRLAQEMLKMSESQREDAEEAASRARAKARKHLQAKMVDAAKEEGRRLGFEAGLRRAQEEADYSNSGPMRPPSAHVRIAAAETQPSELMPDINLDVISSPVHRRASSHARRPNFQEDILEEEHTEVPSSPPFQRVQVHPPTPPESESYAEEESQPATEFTYTAPPPPPMSRVTSPSIVHYAVSIPPASELERQNSQSQYLGKSSQPWVTAQEYHQLAGQQPSPDDVAAFLDRGKVIFAAPSHQANPGKRKESWLRRTLSRPWRKPSTKQAQSWYHPPRPEPTVHVRDFGAPGPPRRSFETGSVSTRMSQFDIISPPPNAPSSSTASGSERSSKGAAKGRRRFREIESALYVINEDPLSRAATPLKKDIVRGSPNMEQVKLLPGETKSNYSDPKAVEEWRRSSASVTPSIPKEMIQEAPVRPPSTVGGRSGPSRGGPSGPPRRRPAHLTVPSLLSPPDAHTFVPQSRAMSGHSQNSPFLKIDDRPGPDRQPTSATIYGITVEPPSRSPTEAPNSARPLQGDFLSPNQTYAPSLRTTPSIATSLNNPAFVNGTATTAPLTPRRSRPGSVASQPPPPPAKSPLMAQSRSLPVEDRPRSMQQGPNDRPRRSSVASHATVNGPNRPRGSVGSGHHSTRQSFSPSPAPGIGYNSSANSHRRTVSDSTYLMPNDGTSMGNGNANEVHGLHRMASNQSMNSVHSANSQYSHFDPSTSEAPDLL
ncbi:hypothetical protein H0H87_001101 [Tephrocybe sp. NHM501043]|nr:hypothetical protein H0H87_001101 [Tephrocybe sp. NHM501043]